MCTNIYVGANKKLPVVIYENERPGFHIIELKEQKQKEFINKILNQKYYYEVGSFMGCTCGLAFGDELKESEPDHYQKRINDVATFFNYLKKHRNSDIKIFVTMWEEFPNGYPIDIMDIDNFPITEFYPKEYTILTIQQKLTQV